MSAENNLVKRFLTYREAVKYLVQAEIEDVDIEELKDEEGNTSYILMVTDGDTEIILRNNGKFS